MKHEKTNDPLKVVGALVLTGVFVFMFYVVRAQITSNPQDDPTAEQQQLNGIYAAVKNALASIPPGSNAPALRRAMANELNNELESFVASHTNSTLTPGVRLELARNAQLRSGYLRAIEHYGQIWGSVKSSSDPASRKLATQAVGGAAKLLALTGRMTELDALEAEARTVFNGQPVGSEWGWAMEMRAWVRKYPAEAYKCGLYCLDQLGRLSQPGQFSPRAITETESSTNGFTAAELVQIGGRVGLRVHAALLNDFANLPVPCIVHLQSEHFVVVRERRGVFYNVYDTLAFGPRWLTAEEIAREASGCVIVSDNVVSASLQAMDSVAAAAYRGRCHSPLAYDHGDNPCPDGTCCRPSGAGGGGSSGGSHGGNTSGSDSPKEGCGSCGGTLIVGMPTWFVSEPYLNLWVQDTPLQYQPAYGPAIRLSLSYTGRRSTSLISYNNVRGAQIGGDGYGDSFWSCSWFSFAELEEGTESSVELRVPGGNWASYSFPANSSASDINYRDNTWLEKIGTSGDITSLVLHHPDGSVTRYAVRDDSHDPNYRIYFMTDQSDPFNNKTLYAYDSNYYLTNVTAADGTTFTLHFDYPSYPEKVTSITSSYGASVNFAYGTSYSVLVLTGITDAAGITSQIDYFNGIYGGQISGITTPYGTTTFYSAGSYMFDRLVQITRPDGTQEFYAQINDYSNTGHTDWPNFDTSQIPTNTPVGTLDTSDRQARNTFYWNAQQYAPYVTTGLSGSWNEFKQARIRHWLANTEPTYTHFDTLSAEQAPSQDGTTEGQITWYDYAGKPSGVNDECGTQIYPSVIARVMPDTSTWYQSFQYNSIGKATNAVEKWNEGSSPLSRTNVYVYAANGVDLTGWTNTLGVRAVSNVFNAYHQVTTSYDALNQATTYTYDATRLQLTSVSRPTGLSTTNLYDGNHRLQTAIDLQINRTNSYTWYSSGDLQTHTDERGLAVTYFWDGLNRLTGTAYPDGTTTTNLFTRGSDILLDKTATKDRMGFWTYYDYDSLRRLTGVTNANNVVTRYGFCDCGAVAYVTNAWGTAQEQDISYDFDFQGNRLHTYLPDTTMTNSYDSLARLTSTADGWGYRYFYYDNLSRLTNVSNAYGAEQGTVFDMENRAVYVTDANGVTVTNTYDDLGRLRTRGYPDGGVEKFGYSVRGLVAYTNQLTLTNFYAYDEAGHKTFETNANAEVIRYTNSAAGDLLSLTDGKNQTTRWKYDQYGRVTNKLDQAGVEILRYKYDPDNRLTNRWSVAKLDTGYKYDSVGNLTNIDYHSSPDVTLTYDSLNRLTNMVDAAGTTKYTYTVGGQLFIEDGPWSNDIVTNIYVNRLRTGLGLQQPTSFWTNKFGYDSAKHLTNVTSPAGTFSYYLGATAPTSAQVKKLLLPNTSYITNTYDGNARLLGTYLKNSSNTTLDSAAYGNNTSNQRTTFTNAAATYVNYSYDKIGQLKVADSSVNSEDRGYLYDAAWNLSTLTNNGAVTNFSVDSKNQLTADAGNNVFYDDNGNLIWRVHGTDPWWWSTAQLLYQYVYDDENRLTSLIYYNYTQTPVWETDFTYDGLGRLRQRVERSSYDSESGTWGSSSETRYVYDGMRVIQERDGNNAPTVSYTRGSDLSGTLEGAGGIGGLLARSDGYSSGNFTSHNFYHADGNGNITYLVNSSQTVAASYRYDPFGNTTSSSGSLASANVYRFSSKEYIASAGLYYYGYRFYDPTLQRWLNSDPIGELGFEVIEGRKGSILAGGPNRFRFARNSPVDYYDPFGLKSTTLRCKPADEKRIRDSLKAACKKFESSNANQCDCLRKNLPPDPAGGDPAGLALADIRKFCKNKVDNDKVDIQCDYSDSTGGCQTSDGAYGDHDSTITFCSKYFNGTTAQGGYTDDCAAIHEIAHWGFGLSPTEQDNASTYDKCFGCPGRKGHK